MTDDKKPRVGVMLFLGHNPLIQPQLSGTHAHLAESVPMIEKSAYDALAKENERLRKDNPDMVDIITMGKKMDFAIQERDRLKSELLNTNELSSKLVEENAALKVEVDMKEYELFVHEERANKFLDETVALEDALKIEREITAMLREALEKIGCNTTFHSLGSIDDCERCKALAKERQMRGE